MPSIRIGLAVLASAPVDLAASAYGVALASGSPEDFPPLPGQEDLTNDLADNFGGSAGLRSWTARVGLEGMLFNRIDGQLKARIAPIPAWVLEKVDYIVEQYEANHPTAQAGYGLGYDADLAELKRFQFWCAWAVDNATPETPAAMEYRA